MDCETTRLALSAALDGEAPGVDLTELDGHLENCADCRAWREAAHELRRRARIGPVTALVAPSAEVLEHIRAEAARPRSRHVERLRLALLMIAVAQIGIALVLLLFGSYDLERDMGASSLALAVGFAIVALRPGRAFAISPVVGTAAGLLVLTALIELATGKTHLVNETPHAIAFVGWLLVHRIGRLTPPTIENRERSLVASLRRWLGRAAGQAYADFTSESHPAGQATGAGAPLVEPRAAPASTAAGGTLRRGAA
jgi:predicted anti-sigma-YlaC factor YlaD